MKIKIREGVTLNFIQSDKSVSYTHLDVYKRQAFGAFCLFCAWLLQTSAPQDTSITGMTIFSEYVKNSFMIFRGQLPTTVGNGGLIGAFLYSLSTLLFDKIGTLIFSVALLLLGVLMFANNKMCIRDSSL